MVFAQLRGRDLVALQQRVDTGQLLFGRHIGGIDQGTNLGQRLQVSVTPARDLAGQLLRGGALLIKRLLHLLAALIRGAGRGVQQRVDQGVAQFVVLVHHEAEQVEVAPLVAAVELRGLGPQHVLGVVGDGLVREAQALPERLQLLEEPPRGREVRHPFADFPGAQALANALEKGERVAPVRLRFAGVGVVGGQQPVQQALLAGLQVLLQAVEQPFLEREQGPRDEVGQRVVGGQLQPVLVQKQHQVIEDRRRLQVLAA